MTDKSQAMDLEEMNAEITRSRKEMAVLTASLEKLVKGKNGKPVVEHEHTGVRHGLAEAGAKGKETALGFGEAIKRHPVITGVTAFSLGFVIALLAFRRG